MIFNDNREQKTHYTDSMTVQESPVHEAYSFPRHWEIVDRLIDAKTGELIKEYNYCNTVVNDCSKLIACLMKAQAGYGGLKYWAVGKGDSQWNNDAPPSPAVTDTKLLVETYRKAIVPATDIVFLDTNNAETATVTSKIQIKVTFLESEANGELREFGLFGGTADGTANSGLMVNRKIHPLIYKTSGMKLERVIRVQF
jgi:hypothetical protein